MRMNVYGVSDWPESRGEEFEIFIGREFVSQEEAIHAAREAYSDDLEVVVVVLPDFLQLPFEERLLPVLWNRFITVV